MQAGFPGNECMLKGRDTGCVMQDHYDVKMPCHLLLSKLAVKAGGQVLAALDPLSNSLETTLTTKLKSDAVQQEVRRVKAQSLCPGVVRSQS